MADNVVEKYSEYDHHDPSISLENVHESWDTLRGQCPIGRSDAYGGMWVVTGFAEANEIFHKPETVLLHAADHPAVPPALKMVPVEIDPPDHFKYRTLVAAPFSPRRAERTVEPLRAIVNQPDRRVHRDRRVRHLPDAGHPVPHAHGDDHARPAERRRQVVRGVDPQDHPHVGHRHGGGRRSGHRALHLLLRPAGGPAGEPRRRHDVPPGGGRGRRREADRRGADGLLPPAPHRQHRHIAEGDRVDAVAAGHGARAARPHGRGPHPASRRPGRGVPPLLGAGRSRPAGRRRTPRSAAPVQGGDQILVLLGAANLDEPGVPRRRHNFTRPVPEPPPHLRDPHPPLPGLPHRPDGDEGAARGVPPPACPTSRCRTVPRSSGPRVRCRA